MATRLCSLNENGEIELQNVTIGNCNENLETLEQQVCHGVHEMDSWKSSDSA